MFVNPAWFLRKPPPTRKVQGRPVENANAVAPAEAVAQGNTPIIESAHHEFHPAPPKDEPPLASIDTHAASIMPQISEADAQPLAAATLAGLTELRSADAEVAAPALLAAAKVHGPIDQTRLKMILQHLDEVGAPDEDRRYVLSHLTGPPDMQEMFSRVHDRTTAEETYAIASTMIDPTKPAERDWLAALQRRLRAIAARFRP